MEKFSLPDGTYWHCSDKYNGLSSTSKKRVEKDSTGSNISLVSIKELIRHRN